MAKTEELAVAIRETENAVTGLLSTQRRVLVVVPDVVAVSVAPTKKPGAQKSFAQLFGAGKDRIMVRRVEEWPARMVRAG